MIAWRCACIALLGALLAVSITPAISQTPPDRELSAGIELVRSGDMEAAVHALSQAARSLELVANRTAELTRAYVYLGVAYLELGQGQLAQAKFMDALA